MDYFMDWTEAIHFGKFYEGQQMRFLRDIKDTEIEVLERLLVIIHSVDQMYVLLAERPDGLNRTCHDRFFTLWKLWALPEEETPLARSLLSVGRAPWTGSPIALPSPKNEVYHLLAIYIKLRKHALQANKHHLERITPAQILAEICSPELRTIHHYDQLRKSLDVKDKDE